MRALGRRVVESGCMSAMWPSPASCLLRVTRGAHGRGAQCLRRAQERRPRPQSLTLAGGSRPRTHWPRGPLTAPPGGQLTPHPRHSAPRGLWGVPGQLHSVPAHSHSPQNDRLSPLCPMLWRLSAFHATETHQQTHSQKEPLFPYQGSGSGQSRATSVARERPGSSRIPAASLASPGPQGSLEPLCPPQRPSRWAEKSRASEGLPGRAQLPKTSPHGHRPKVPTSHPQLPDM